MRAKSLPSILSIVVASAASVIALYYKAIPGGTFDLLLLASVSWAAAGVAWLILLFTRGRSLVLATPPVLAVATFALMWTGLPLWAGFQVSKSDLARHVETGEPGRAGIYRLGKPVVANGPVRLPVRNAGFVFTECGFLYAPGGVPAGYRAAEVESVEYGHLEGPWYWYEIQES
ncbi:hypothetical protein ACRYCC_17210 [Actinomadura scrupuli]|uniref:hypothetical protein n=1 Tax=Actinomadura scrupuli TaxID=559629 RepID=UPI003D98439E